MSVATEQRPRLSPGRPKLRWVLLAMLVGYLLFAHPCHGDQDTELLSRFWIGD